MLRPYKGLQAASVSNVEAVLVGTSIKEEEGWLCYVSAWLGMCFFPSSDQERADTLSMAVLSRFCAFVVLVAHVANAWQTPALIGPDGLLPYGDYLDAVERHYGGKWEGMQRLPSLLVLLPYSSLSLQLVCYGAVVCAAIVLFTGCRHWLLWAGMLAAQMSVANAGQIFFGYGWETQLIETLWLLLAYHFFNGARAYVWMLRLLNFKLMLGAGLIKIRGDQCWRDLTCMSYHYLTQPHPSPLSYYLHALPPSFHMFEVMVNHAIELVCPFLVLLPFRMPQRVGGVLFVLFQFILILSGNLSYLNYLTCVPALASLDDEFWAYLGRTFSGRWGQGAGGGRGGRRHCNQYARTAKGHQRAARSLRANALLVSSILFTALLLVLTVRGPWANLLSRNQRMNTSFDSLNLCNTYGAFGSISHHRYELLIEARGGDNTSWKAYEFPCKPTGLDRRPCLVGPYHHRIGWQLWFAAFHRTHHKRHVDWLIRLVFELLRGNRLVLGSLVELAPYAKPSEIRIRRVRYEFKYGGGKEWWERAGVPEMYLHPISRSQVEISNSPR